MLGIPIQTCWSLKAVCSVIRTKEGRALRLECCLLKIRVATPRRKGSYNMLDTTLSHTGWPFPNYLHIGFIDQYLFVNLIKDFTESFQNLLEYIEWSNISRKFRQFLTIPRKSWQSWITRRRYSRQFDPIRSDIFGFSHTSNNLSLFKFIPLYSSGVDLQVFKSLFAENFQHLRN